MLINDTVLQVKGTSVLFGRVRETKKEGKWTYVKVKWVPTTAYKALQENLRSLLEIRRKDFDPETEWIRCDKLVKFDKEQTIEDINKLND
jgi:hypothetical protein